MKRALFLFLTLMLVPAMVFAGMQTRALDDADGTSLSAYALTSGSAVYSETIRLSDAPTDATLLITENKAGGAGDVDISAEFSTDATNWYSTYTSNGLGTIAITGDNIATALGNSTRWIVFTPRLAPFMRLKFDPDADSQITAALITQE